MSDVTLYLHIGATKTGSTALQRFLEQNFSRLLTQFGVLYPNFHDRELHSPMRPGFNYWQGHHFENEAASTDLDLFNRCIEHCKRNSIHTIVISHEALLVNWHERVGRLAGKLDAGIKIICYVRRQDHHLESAWKQWGHKFVRSSDLMGSLENTKWGGWRATDWHRLLAPWAANFGRQNIIVRPYEKQQMPGGILPDFLNTINVAWPELPTLDDSVNVNAGFSRDVLELLSLNSGFYQDLHDQRLHNMLNQLLDDRFKKKPFETYGILSPRDRIALLTKYEPSNQSLAREYLGRPDGRLFYEPWPGQDDPWEPYEGLTAEKLAPIFTDMIYKLYVEYSTFRSIRKRTGWLFKLERSLRSGPRLAGLRAWLRRLRGNRSEDGGPE